MKKNCKRIACLASLFLLFALLAGCAPSNDASPAYERGTWNNGVYKNTFFGIQLTLPEDWKADTDEELAERMGVAMDTVAQGIGADASSLKQRVSYEFFVYNEKTLSNISFNVEKLSSSLSEEEYLSAVKLQLEKMENIQVTFGEETSVSIGGQEWLCHSMTAVSQGSTVEQKTYLLSKDTYMACLTASYTPGNSADIEALVSGITPLS